MTGSAPKGRLRCAVRKRGGVPASQPSSSPSLGHPLGPELRMLRSRGTARRCELEVAVLDRSNGRRAFRRALEAEVAEAFGRRQPSGQEGRRVTCRWVAMPGSQGGRPGSPSNQYQQYDFTPPFRRHHRPAARIDEGPHLTPLVATTTRLESGYAEERDYSLSALLQPSRRHQR